MLRTEWTVVKHAECHDGDDCPTTSDIIIHVGR